MSADPHKRTKSGIARSLLSRVSSRNDVSNATDDDSMGRLSRTTSGLSMSSQAPTPHSAPPVPALPTSSAASQRSSSQRKPPLSTSMTHTERHDGSSPASVSAGASRQQAQSPGGQPTGTSIEQSVKLFRIFEALRSGDTAAISKSIREQDSVDESGHSKLEGTTVLHLAIQCAEQNVVEYIMSSASLGGMNVNAKDRDGNTALHIAATLGRAPVVSLLLHAGANDSIANYQGQTALDVARTPEIFQQLQLARSLFIDATVKKIQSLVSNADYTNLERLLQEQRIRDTLDVNGGELATDPSTVESGGTLLHEAARKRDVKLIQLLLLNGADPFRRDRKGKLPQDVTKDDRTRAIIKKSPAAAAAQRGIQEKTILGAASQSSLGISTAQDSALSGNKEAREMKGYLKKWTNYTSGWKLRWFVLEDGVLSYYKHQDDAGSACRGAINMKIARLYMDPQDKLRFEIQGKSSVKYHLRANHQIEAKRWYWALNNAIQWAKDEAREEGKRQKREDEALRQMKVESVIAKRDGDESSVHSSHIGTKRNYMTSSGHLGEDAEHSPYEQSISGEGLGRFASNMGTTMVGDDDDGNVDFHDDASSHEGAAAPVSRDAFNITAQSAKLQLDLLAQVTHALQSEQGKNPDMKLSDAAAVQALHSYEAAVGNLKGLVGDLLKISRDRDAYWQYRLDHEANIRRMWEESMTKVAQEQEELQAKMGESEDKRRKTKRALRDALEGLGTAPDSRPRTPDRRATVYMDAPLHNLATDANDTLEPPVVVSSPPRRKTVIDIDLSDSESDQDDEFFDAVGAGEVEIVEDLPEVTSPPVDESKKLEAIPTGLVKDRESAIQPSFAGYEDPVRKRLKLDGDNRPKISLWGVLKSMIGKDMTKMTLPVSFNEPTSLLQRVAEDMEYTDLLDTAAERTDATERMVYVAAFAASEYASTIGRVAKPFNPLLGETFEYCRPDKGYRFFSEQVSHHPPIGAIWAEAPRWTYWGESNVNTKFYGKSFDISHLGTWFLRLHTEDGGEELYSWKKAKASVIGIITGNPTVDNYGPMEIKNWTSGETCILDFKPRGWKASSAYQVSGKVADSTGNTRWSVGGRWNDKLFARLTPGFEGVVEPPKHSSATGPLRQDTSAENKAFLVWEAHARPTGMPFNLTPFGITLNAIPDGLRGVIAPTDTRLRPDQRAMEDGEYDLASTEKNRVEEKQRKTRRIREANGEEFTPRWFSKEIEPTTGEEFWRFSGQYWDVRSRVVEGKTAWIDNNLEDIF